MRQVSKIVLATTNRHKVEEIQNLIKAYTSIEVVPADEMIANADKLGLVEIYNTFSENVFAKARACNHACHYPSLADDSGLEVNALEGLPGVKSHRYAIPRAGETQDQANNLKLQNAMKNQSVRSARFVCHLALVMEGILIHSVGTLEGNIADKPAGNQGFGYDPLFIPNGYKETLAELGPDVKNKISHRALAVKNLMEEIQRHGIVLAKP